jgi:ankyrin repeat protein
VARFLLEEHQLDVNAECNASRRSSFSVEDLSPEHGGGAGCTPLFLAAQQGEVLMCAVLIEAGAALGMRAPGGITPLIIAAGADYTGHDSAMHAAVVSQLMEAGADVNAKTRDLKTALHMAVNNGQTEICRLLVRARDLDMHAAMDTGATPILCAAERVEDPHLNSPVDTCRVLLEAGADALCFVNARSNLSPTTTALHVCTQHASVNMVRFFLEEAGADPNNQDANLQTPLHLAATNAGKRNPDYMVAICKLLLDAGTDVNLRTLTHGLTALMLATSSGQHAVCRVLVEASGIDLNLAAEEIQYTAMHIAARNGDDEMAKILALAGADCGIRDRYPPTLPTLPTLPTDHTAHRPQCPPPILTLSLHLFTPPPPLTAITITAMTSNGHSPSWLARNECSHPSAGPELAKHLEEGGGAHWFRCAGPNQQRIHLWNDSSKVD